MLYNNTITIFSRKDTKIAKRLPYAWLLLLPNQDSNPDRQNQNL